jgi:hypothetical protein
MSSSVNKVRKLVREAIKNSFIILPTTLNGFKDMLVDVIDASGAWKLAASIRDANLLQGGKYVSILRAWQRIEKDKASGIGWSECVEKHVRPMILELTNNDRLADRVVRRMK